MQIQGESEIPDFIIDSRTQPDGTRIYFIDEDACDALYSNLQDHPWQMPTWQYTVTFTPVWRAYRQIVNQYQEQFSDSVYTEFELDDKSLEMVGQVLEQHMRPTLEASLEELLSETEAYLETASPNDRFTRNTGKYHNPLHVYIRNCHRFDEDVKECFGNRKKIPILDRYIRETVLYAFEAGLKYETNFGDTKKSRIELERKFAGMSNLDELFITDSIKFIMDPTQEENHPIISGMIDLIWKTSRGEPLNKEESLNIFLEVIDHLLRQDFYNPNNYFTKEQGEDETIKAAERRYALIKLIQRNYAPIIDNLLLNGVHPGVGTQNILEILLEKELVRA